MDNTDQIEKSSYKEFVNNFQQLASLSSVSWNKDREYFLKEDLNKRKIILQEIYQFDFKNPINIINSDYMKDNYNLNLFLEEVKNFETLFSDNTINNLMTKRENLEMTKKIIEYYLTYIVELNFESIMNSLKKLNTLEKNLVICFHKVSQNKTKMKEIKFHILQSTSKLLLYKQKLKNLFNIYEILQERLSKYLLLFRNSKKLKAIGNYSMFYKNMIEIQSDIQIASVKNNLRSLIINDILLMKSKNKLNKLQLYIEKQFNHIFIERKNNYKDIFSYYLNTNIMDVNKYMEFLINNYKKTIFNLIKGTMSAFTEDNKSYIIQEITKIRELTMFKYEENKFVQAINQLIKNLSNISKCFEYIYEFHINIKENDLNIEEYEANKSMISLLNSKKSVFYEIIEKKYSKILKLFNYLIMEANMRNMISIVVYNCLFGEVIKSNFNFDYSKYLNLQTKNIVIYNLKYHIIQSIKKIGILLGGDNWKRIALQDDHNFFSSSKLQEKVPLFVKNLIVIFNETKFINKSNINSMFNKYIDIFSDNNIILSDDPKLEILSKNLNIKNLILSSSTVTLNKSILDLIIFLVFFENLIFEIFLQIFNVFDYYIIACLNMFMDKKYLGSLIEQINIEEMRKKVKIEQIFENICFQKRFSHIKRFITKSVKNLEVLFESEIDMLKNNYDSDNYEASEFNLPKLNSQVIINDNNIYTCMIEAIIMFESIYSIYKIIKRIKHFSKKIELEFQSKIICNTIDNYKIIIKELKTFIFKPICNNIFKIDPIMNKVLNYKWDPKESESENNFSEANIFIENIFQEICEKYDKLYLLSAGSLTEKSQRRFLDVILTHINEKLLETFSKIKKCNSCGRSIMLKDIKFLKSKIENKFNKDVHLYFGEIELYINAWYCSEDEFIKFIEDSHLNYKYINGIMNTGPNFVKMSRQQKKDYNLKIEETYYTIMENIKISMLDN